MAKAESDKKRVRARILLNKDSRTTRQKGTKDMLGIGLIRFLDYG